MKILCIWSYYTIMYMKKLTKKIHTLLVGPRAARRARTYRLWLLYVGHGHRTVSPLVRNYMVQARFSFVLYQLSHYGSERPNSAIRVN